MVYNGLLEDKDFALSHNQDDAQSQASGSYAASGSRRKVCLSRDLSISDTSSDGDGADNEGSDTSRNGAIHRLS